MSTLAETQAILRPYAERHPDLVLMGRAVILRPMRHLMCGYFLDRTSSPERLRPFWFANIVYRFVPGTGFLWAGDQIPRSSDTRADNFQDILFAHMDRAFAELRKFNGAVDIFDIDLPMNRDLAQNSLVAGLTRVARGDLEGAEPFLRSELAYQTHDLEDRLSFMANTAAKAASRGGGTWQPMPFLRGQEPIARCWSIWSPNAIWLVWQACSATGRDSTFKIGKRRNTGYRRPFLSSPKLRFPRVGDASRRC